MFLINLIILSLYAAYNAYKQGTNHENIVFDFFECFEFCRPFFIFTFLSFHRTFGQLYLIV